MMFFQLSSSAPTSSVDGPQQFFQHHHHHHQFLPSISPLFDTSGAGMLAAPTTASLFMPSLFGGCGGAAAGDGTTTAAGSLMQSLLSAAVCSGAFPLVGTTVAASPLTPTSQHRKLFIGGLSHETTDEQLRDYYSKWGKVIDCIVIRDPVTRQSRGFGFVTYATIEMADSAMADRPHTIAGKVVDPKRAIPREQMLQATSCPPAFLDVEPPSDCKLFLSGISHHTVDILRHYFERFGELEQVEIVGHTGHGFIVFEKRASADKCVAHGKQHMINGRKVDIARQQGTAAQHHRHVKPKSPPLK
ncbi:hypothetical protein niasHS_012607 [Heterodera schachtii]|uniref:RRM domain-containing protein n=1 Tax=Heterodera schachtii TaxID=97005 RepID=A0ABD2I9J9_HETSC